MAKKTKSKPTTTTTPARDAVAYVEARYLEALPGHVRARLERKREAVRRREGAR